MQSWMIVRESYSHALEQRTLPDTPHDRRLKEFSFGGGGNHPHSLSHPVPVRGCWTFRQRRKSAGLGISIHIRHLSCEKYLS